jgi:hypothetical protein
MGLILRVTYPATDGSMPESVELEWDTYPGADGVLRLLERLLSAPAEHRAGLFPLRTVPAATSSGAYVLTHSVRRGDILAVCADEVRNVGAMAADVPFDAAAPVDQDLSAGARVALVNGSWHKLGETR